MHSHSAPDSPDSKLLMEASVKKICNCCPKSMQDVFFASYVPAEDKKSKPGDDGPDEIELPDLDDLDSNNDGEITQDEVGEKCDVPKAEKTFGDGDGKLTLFELHEGCDSVCVPESENMKVHNSPSPSFVMQNSKSTLCLLGLLSVLFA